VEDEINYTQNNSNSDKFKKDLLSPGGRGFTLLDREYYLTG
jgi:hypothetical protein